MDPVIAGLILLFVICVVLGITWAIRLPKETDAQFAYDELYRTQHQLDLVTSDLAEATRALRDERLATARALNANRYINGELTKAREHEISLEAKVREQEAALETYRQHEALRTF